MNKFGVCNYDFNADNPKIENLVGFENYDQAFKYYMKKLNEDEHYPYWFDRSLWVVWINEDGNINQFEQLSINIRCKVVTV